MIKVFFSEVVELTKIQNVVVHCNEQHMAEKILTYADKYGLKWVNGHSYVEEFRFCPGGDFYNLTSGLHSSKREYFVESRIKFRMIEFDEIEFDEQYNKQEEIKFENKNAKMALIVE